LGPVRRDQLDLTRCTHCNGIAASGGELSRTRNRGASQRGDRSGCRAHPRAGRALGAVPSAPVRSWADSGWEMTLATSAFAWT